MAAAKGIVLFHLFASAVLVTSSNAKRLRLLSNKTTLSSYSSYINELFPDKSTKRRARHLAGFMNNTPSGKIKVQLFCRTGFLLEVLDNGRIAGTRNVSSRNTIIEFEIFNENTRRMKGVASGRYLSLNNRGRLSSTANFDQNKSTFFHENPEENLWFTYSSSHHTKNCSGKKNSSRGYIAIKKNGALKRPCKTEPGMHSTHFIVLPQKRKAVVVDKHTGTGV